MPASAGSGRRRPSRQEIESLCILHALRAAARSASELAAALGLSPALAGAAASAAGTLVTASWVQMVEGRYQLTTHGREHLASRLDELGIR